MRNMRISIYIKKVENKIIDYNIMLDHKKIRSTNILIKNYLIKL